jgi:tRNA nucleotidyltransferase (CCA-adding enzyme)
VHRVAGLLHDLGKPATRALSEKTGDYTFYNHENVGARMADRWLKRLRFSNEDREHIVHLVRNHLVCYSDAWSDAAVRRFVKRVGVDNLDSLLALARADALAKGREVEQELAGLVRLQERVRQVLDAGAALSTRDLAMDGHDVMQHLGIAPGRKVGKVLDELLSRVLDDPGLNDRQALLRAVDEIADQV